MLEWVATFFSMLGLVGNAHHKMWCWPVWLIGSGIYVVSFAWEQRWAPCVLFASFEVLNVYGWLNWRKEAKLHAVASA